jgi:Raf kinase inhibitor-like YbhB/YbcL family protein
MVYHVLRVAVLAAVVGGVITASLTPAGAQEGDGTDVPITSHVFKPQKVEATPDRVTGLKVPDGIRIAVFADGLKNIRVLAVGPEGRIYAARREQGDVIMLEDRNGDGRADAPPKVVAHRAGAHGLAIKDKTLYLITVKEVFTTEIKPDGSLGALQMIIGDLPDAGQHPNRTIAVGPDNALYISVGSTCNACNESNPEHATILRAGLDGKSRTIFASGLRNTIGFSWHPITGELWGMDHGIDFLGDDIQPEELNHIQRGKQYGWPHVWGDGGLYPQSNPPGELTKDDWKAISTPMVLGYTAHAAPMQFVFYTGAALPRDYQNDAFVTLRGSWNRKAASGYEVARIRFKDGKPQSVEPFITGFLTDGGRAFFGRPMGLVQAADGSLLMGDDVNGVIYRISGTGKQATASAKPAPDDAMKEQTSRGIGVPLALKREETKRVELKNAAGGGVSDDKASDGKGSAELSVTSLTFNNNGALPQHTSEYSDGVAPQLSWTKIPGAQSYALVMEDPDAKPITPFVHWVAWNIPADVVSLPEGLQEHIRLTEPNGLMQGPTSRGSVGYFGPRPPVGDPPHHYHFQVFALDTTLRIPPHSDRDAVLAAMKGYVIAKGEIVGTFQQLIKPPK